MIADVTVRCLCVVHSLAVRPCVLPLPHGVIRVLLPCVGAVAPLSMACPPPRCMPSPCICPAHRSSAIQESGGGAAEQPRAALPAIPAAATTLRGTRPDMPASDLQLTAGRSSTGSNSSSSEPSGRTEPGTGPMAPPAAPPSCLPSDVQPVSARTTLLLAHPGYDADVAAEACKPLDLPPCT